MAVDLQRAKDIFLAALDRAEQERAAYLGQACGADAELRSRVEALLHAHAAPGSFFDAEPRSPVTGDFVPTAPDDAAMIGTAIGPYKLLRNLGEGGMGVVWLAEQSAPVQRQVALKVIKTGLDSAQVLARFDAERQALARMDHPHIAKVLEVGESPLPGGGGLVRPYFVMELVAGIPITHHCDREHLSPRQRLELFIPVCQAVQHAHQKGIIHRDLKPSNVLVGMYDGRPVPKIIDFGVAKATRRGHSESTAFTEIGQVVGTLEYMAPEQAELNNLDIDTRADIYALGVILYELLAGSPPFTRKQLQSAAFTEMLRIIREVEPQKPSTRLSSSDELPSIAANRTLEPKRLTRLVSGDLDWIVMKCLEKERTRRYETANGLALDLQRYLADEPVSAGPPARVYRLRKFVRRNRGAVIAAGLLLASLVAGIGATAWQWRRAAASERQVIIDRDAARAAAEAEKTARDNANAVIEFFDRNVFAAARPEGRAEGLGRQVTLRQAIEAALPALDKGFGRQPLVEARLRMTLASSFYYLGDARAAARQYDLARTLFARHSGPDHINTVMCAMGLANCYSALGQSVDALKLREETVATMRGQFGLDHADTLMAMNNLANSYHDLGRHREALGLREDVLRGRQAVLGADDPDTLMSMSNLANSYFAVGRRDDAFKLRDETLTRQRTVLGADHLDTVASMHNLASSYASLGRPAEALKLVEVAYARRRALLGPDHAQTLSSMSNLAACLTDLARYEESLALDKEALALRRGKHGPTHPDTLQSMNNLAFTYAVMGRHTDALKLREETLALRRAKLGPYHPNTLHSMNYVSASLAALGRHDEALQLREETLALRKTHIGPDHPDTLQSMHNVALSFAATGRHAEALKLHETTLELRKTKLGPTNRYIKESLYSIACVHALMIPKAVDPAQQADVAMDWLKQAVEAGFTNAAHMKTDKDLDALRGRPDFHALLARCEQLANPKP